MRIRLPIFVVAGVLLGLLVVLATLQYRWLGQISADERERRSAALATQAKAFADDFDRELTRAYLLFQWEPAPGLESLAERVAGRYDRWQETARLPQLVRDVYVVGTDGLGDPSLQRFDPASRLLERAGWPDELAPLRALAEQKLPEPSSGGAAVTRALPPPLWDNVPALVVPMPTMQFQSQPEASEFRLNFAISYAVLALDREFVTREWFPALVDEYFGADSGEFQLAVVEAGSGQVVYQSVEHFSPPADAATDASSDLFQVRPQEFGGMASEIRRISTIVPLPGDGGIGPPGGQAFVRRAPDGRRLVSGATRIEIREGVGMSVLLPPDAAPQDRAAVTTGTGSMLATRPFGGPARWKLLVQHRFGSLEAAVDAARRRNLAISFGILGLLGVSVGLLVVSTRRAQQLARQQMAFVAAVSHELRTPLAVIRSAGDNLADGVVAGADAVRQYGELVRGEGRRLTDMVEQILELSGIHSRERAFVLRPVALRPLVEDVIAASRPLVDAAALDVQIEIPETLPPVLADERALGRVVQNLVGNAIKYGAGGGTIRVAGTARGREVQLSVADRGIGIAFSDQARIFEPFYRAAEVVAAQIQGAGLGLSLVKRIVESHGGRVEVRSAPGQGSEFTVTLPAAVAEHVVRCAEAGGEAVDAQGHGSRV
jgi:signal transduction histidine kinase